MRAGPPDLTLGSTLAGSAGESRFSHEPQKRLPEAGFALVTALLFTALLALIVVLIEGWLTSSSDRAFRAKGEIQARVTVIDAVERVGFTLLSSEASRRGFEIPASQPGAGTATDPSSQSDPQRRPYLAADGRPYLAAGATVQLQDGGGLFDIGKADRDSFQKLFATYGLSEQDGAELATALFDYVGLPNAGTGAREAAYRAEGLPPQRHASLVSPWEPLRILGWRQAAALWAGAEPFGDIATLGPIRILNPNTAPARVLMSSGGINSAEAARLVANRRAADDAGTEAPQSGAGQKDNRSDRPIASAPSDILRLTVTAPQDPLRHVYGLRLTPLESSPLHIDYALDLPNRAPGGLAAEPLPAMPGR